MPRLYELTGEFRAIEQLIAEQGGEVEDGELAAMIDIRDDVNTKVAGIAKLIRNLKSDRDAFYNEATRLGDKANSLDNRIKWLKNYVKNNLMAIGKTEAGDEIAGFQIIRCKAKVLIVNEGIVPDNFKTTETLTMIDKDAIYNEWKLTKNDIPGVTIENNNFYAKLK